ncbi:hypothetical protein GRX03_03040 [Halovenus sp. WSH3]|uniref:Nickel/cobalt efflux system n=1 Tax=Halovenus carboxidivorans TaxID=2692199 RepID=A0A6B0SYW0_9EURY|nr:hypothetical protein [Halovenus carboxidivorans]MXR50585.1 hypothetical protein [Halovenus carboxidivorans]
MFHADAGGVVIGAVLLGGVHGIEPGHGWPIAASYALDRQRKWLYGITAGLIIGIGHLISSIAMVGVFFYAKEFAGLTAINEPITLAGTVRIGGPVSIVAGLFLVALGVREYRHGHSHGGGHDHPHENDTHDHGESGRSHGDDGHSHETDGRSRRHGDHSNGADSHPHRDDEHSHGRLSEGADRGLLGLTWAAFVLGFAHEEEFEIIALCAGSEHCLGLMLAYAGAVIVGIVGLTVALIAGYRRYERRIERYTPYLPAFSAAVLCLMGVGFVTGLL